MFLPQANWVQQGDQVDYTPVGAVASGAVVIVGNQALIAKRDIAAGALGSLSETGVFDVVKDSSVFSAGDVVYWNATGTPANSALSASSGAATSTPGTNVLMGIVTPDGAALTGDYTVRVRIGSAAQGKVPRLPVAAVTVGGNTQANANALIEGFNLVSGADNTNAVILPANKAGMQVKVKSITSGKILIVLPPVGSKINGATANALYNHANLAERTYTCFNATDWFTAPETPT